jgi:hypothetical protein
MDINDTEKWLREANRCCSDFSIEDSKQTEITKEELEKHQQGNSGNLSDSPCNQSKN